MDLQRKAIGWFFNYMHSSIHLYLGLFNFRSMLDTELDYVRYGHRESVHVFVHSFKILKGFPKYSRIFVTFYKLTYNVIQGFLLQGAGISCYHLVLICFI